MQCHFSQRTLLTSLRIKGRFKRVCGNATSTAYTYTVCMAGRILFRIPRPSSAALPPSYRVASEGRGDALFERGKGKGGERWKKASPILHRSPFPPSPGFFFMGAVPNHFPPLQSSCFGVIFFASLFSFFRPFVAKGLWPPEATLHTSSPRHFAKEYDTSKRTPFFPLSKPT